MMAKLKDHTNMIFGQFKIIEDLGMKYPKMNSKKKKRYVEVLCLDCTNKKQLILDNLKRLNPSCDCVPIIKPLKNDIGLFVVIKDLGMRERNSGNRKKYRECIVECKKCSKQQQGEYSSFRSLHRSCECQQKSEFTKERKRIYKIYHSMISRCHDKEHQSYKYYGARGVSVYKEWLSSYYPFYEWAIKNGYSNKLTIDRIDCNGNYEPNNCRWADTITQARNKRHVISVEKVKEIKKLLKEGYTHHKIADMVNTTHHRVSMISKGTSWKDI